MEKYDYLDGKYELLEKLHEGGMGTIYKVRHRLLDEIRVIKVMRPQHETNEGLRARFLREAQMAVRLRHPNIAQMYDFAFDESGRGYIVMEYVAGISLQQMLERVGAPSLRLSLDIARQTLTGLGFLHRKGIVHRDISPDNLMVAWDEFGRPMVKLIDLGIAKVVTSTTALTVSGTFLGKLLYASPEQFGGSADKVDQRSDIYSFGVVLYELFTGNHPFPGASPQELIAGHLVKPPLDFAIGDPDGRVPEDLRAIVLKAIAKKPDDRYAGAEALDEALAAVQARFPLDPDEFTRILQAHDASQPGTRIPKPAPGSTQRHIAAQFGMAVTPQPISLPDAPDPHSTAPTLLAPPNGAANANPVRQGGVSPETAAPTQTNPIPIVPHLTSAPTVQAAGAVADDGAPAAPASAAATTPAAVAQPAIGKRTLRLLLAAGGVVAVIAVGFVVGRGIVRRERPPTATEPALRVSPMPEPAAAPARADLESAVAAGSVDRLRVLLANLSDAGRAAIAAAPGGAQILDLARRSVEADAALARAANAKNWAAALQEASALVALLPASREARQERERAAAALEAQADALVRQGQADAAFARLQALQRAWPQRPGLEARLAGVHAARKAESGFAAALAAAAAAERERRPELGLDALAQVTPNARWSDRFAAARERLESLLAQLDTAPPVVRLKPGSRTSYSKGKPFLLTVIVTDDYRVKSVTVMARQEGTAAYQELPARSTGADEYTVEITPQFHDNKTVEIYVVATDFAGHSSRLGTAEQPLRIKKRWLF